MDLPLTSSDHLMERDQEQGFESSVPRGEERADISGEPGYNNNGHSPNPQSGESLTKNGMLSMQDFQHKNGLLVLAIVTTVIYVTGGLILLMVGLGWSFTNSVYFLAITVSTIGYGDLVVSVSWARVINSLLILVGFVSAGAWASYLAQFEIEGSLFGNCGISKAVDEYHKNAQKAGVDPSPRFEYQLKVKQAKREALFWVLFLGISMMIGMTAFMCAEGDLMSTSFYWAVVTATTVGYGDVVPTTIVMKWFTVVWSMISTLLLVQTLQVLITLPLKIKQWQAQEEVLVQYSESLQGDFYLRLKQTISHLGMAEDRDSVTRSEFALSMLSLLGRITADDYREVSKVFDALDVDGDGVLSINDDVKAENKRNHAAAFLRRSKSRAYSSEVDRFEGMRRSGWSLMERFSVGSWSSSGSRPSLFPFSREDESVSRGMNESKGGNSI